MESKGSSLKIASDRPARELGRELNHHSRSNPGLIVRSQTPEHEQVASFD